MIDRSIKIRILKHTSSTVTVKLMSANRKMRMPKANFLSHLEQGTYNILNPGIVDEIKE
ncbi:MAG: hypothetical protein AAGI49_02560 [Bacteroidota bacterium]